MIRNLLTLFATVSVGATTASAAVPSAVDQSLDQRLLNAQKQIELFTNSQNANEPPQGIQEAYYCPYGYPCWNNWHKWNNWNNWNNWHNWHNYYNNYAPPGY